MLTGRRNIHVDVVGNTTSDTRITDAIHDAGVQIESSEMMRRRYVQPFNRFFLQGSDELDSDLRYSQYSSGSCVFTPVGVNFHRYSARCCGISTVA